MSSRKAEIARHAAVVFEAQGTHIYLSLCQLLDMMYEDTKEQMVAAPQGDVHVLQAKAKTLREVKRLIERPPLKTGSEE